MFNLGEILIPFDQQDQLYRFYDLLEVFAESTVSTNSQMLNGLYLLKFIFTIDHWSFEETRQLRDIKKIQTLAKDYENLLEVAIGIEDSSTDYITKMCKILYSMNQLTDFQIQHSSKNMVNSSLVYGLSFEEMNWVIKITKTVKEIFGPSAAHEESKGLFNELNYLRKGEATEMKTEDYRSVKRIFQEIQETIEKKLLLVMERIEDGLYKVQSFVHYWNSNEIGHLSFLHFRTISI